MTAKSKRTSSRRASDYALIYRTNGDFADMVPVRMDIDRLRIISYPHPTEMSDSTAPVKLSHDFFLDLQWIDAGTVFLRIDRKTYSEYDGLPSKNFIYDHLMPESGVTEIVRLPMTTMEALADTSIVNRIIVDGLKDCKIIYDKGRRKQPEQLILGTSRF